EIGLPPVKISAIIVMGASLGSIMPPISQATFLSSSLLGIDPKEVIQPTYLTIGIGVIFSILVILFVYLRKGNIGLSKELIPQENIIEILKAKWKTLIPLIFLVLLVITDNLTNMNVIGSAFISL